MHKRIFQKTRSIFLEYFSHVCKQVNRVVQMMVLVKLNVVRTALVIKIISICINLQFSTLVHSWNLMEFMFPFLDNYDNAVNN